MDSPTQWQLPATHPALAPGQVHLWRLSLLVGPEQIAASRSLLGPDELAKAERFHFPRDQRRYTLARGALRRLLAAYLSRPAGDIRFVYNPQGKPALPTAELSFNLSHSGEIALFAFGRQGRVGVDIERHRPLDDLHALAESLFSQRELADLHSLPQAQQQTAFYDCWTRKEAFVKAIGDGLTYPLAQFDVSLLPGEAAALLRVKEEAQPANRWQMAAFAPASGFSGAIVVEGQGQELSFWGCAG